MPFLSSSEFLFLSFVEMALTSSKFSSVFLSSITGDSLKKPIFATTDLIVALSMPSPSLSLAPKGLGGRNLRVVAVGIENSTALTGIIFEPFEEVKNKVLAVPMSPQVSMARQHYVDECEAAINKQIKLAHIYFAANKFFNEASEEEREHTEKLMKYQNIHGGRVVLHPIKPPPFEYEHLEKGDALYAMELALALEKLTNEELC